MYYKILLKLMGGGNVGKICSYFGKHSGTVVCREGMIRHCYHGEGLTPKLNPKEAK
jgi:hypothetical protein